MPKSDLSSDQVHIVSIELSSVQSSPSVNWTELKVQFVPITDDVYIEFFKKEKKVLLQFQIPINSITVIVRREYFVVEWLEDSEVVCVFWFLLYYFPKKKPECRFSEPLFPVVKIIQKQPEQRLFFSKKILDELKACKL